MSRTQHHDRAKELLSDARTEPDSFRRRLILAEAQVHATLALSAPAGKDPPGPGQDRAADIKSTGAAHPGMAKGTNKVPARPAGQPRPGGARPPTDNEPVRKVAQPAPAEYVRTGTPRNRYPARVPGQPEPPGPGKKEPGDPGDQKLRGPGGPKPGSSRRSSAGHR